jgi:alpha-beta hydrolase superfamily lysophospholipase
VVSVSAFAHPAAMMQRWLAAKRIPARTVGRYILGYVQEIIGHRFDDIAPVATIARVRCPIMLVHGAADDVVPSTEAREIFAARGDAPVVLRIVDGIHDSFSDLERHMQDVIAFLSGAMQSGAAGPTRCAM